MTPQISAELRALAASHPESVTDEELMGLLAVCSARDEQDVLFAEFHRRFHTRVTNWCFRLSRSRARALDLTQEVFLKAWRHMAAFRGDSRPSTWLYVITRNHCLSALQRVTSDPLEFCAPLPLRLQDKAAAHPDREIERRQLRRDIFTLVSSTLEPMEAKVMTLHYGYEIPLGTLTTRLELRNPSGAKAYIVNGRRKLKNALLRRNAATVPPARRRLAAI